MVLILTLETLVAPVAPAGAQIVIHGSAFGYNEFGSGIGVPLSGDMGNPGDVWIENDIEIGGELYLEKTIYMNRDSTSPESGNQVIYFADDGSQDDESFAWRDSDDAFYFSDDIALSGSANIEAIGGSFLNLLTEARHISFVVDSNGDEPLSSTAHTFIWYNDTISAGSRAMQLQSDSSDVGDLSIGGQLTQNATFDIAESFWMSEPLEPGELVAVDPSRSDAVVKSSAAYDRGIIGVVSTRPGIVMGGGAFSSEQLQRAWGEEVAAEWLGEIPRLEAAVYKSSEGLRRERDRLYSEATYRQYLEGSRRKSTTSPSAGEVRDDEWRVDQETLSRSDLTERHERAKREHALSVHDQVMQRFFDEHFADVALAGRVPVKVDASFGVIEVGDPLTASPAPGLAMKATRSGPIIGTALEAHAGGEGRITALIHRGWYSGEERLEAARLEKREKVSEITRLRRANAELSHRLAWLERAVFGGPAARKPTPRAERASR